MNLKEAIKIMELDDTDISIKIVKKKYRELQKKYHPDVSNNFNRDILNRINEAYRFLIDFLESFTVSLDNLLNSVSDEEKILRRFSNDWLSGKKL